MDHRRHDACRAVLFAALACLAFARSAHAQQYISFSDLAPAYLTLTQSWNALGADDQGRIYSLWTSTRDDGREDAALFRYTPETKERKFLGTFIDVATRQNNIRDGEQIPKGHTRIVQVGRKLYMGSQGFHDFKQGIESLPDYRGAHLFAYDLDTGAFDDLARNLPGGVVIEHQGIVALNYSPEHNLLVGLAHPLGDLVLFDLATNKVRKVVPGIPWETNHYVSREIVVTRKGKVFTYRGSEEPDYRADTNEVWAYDIAKDSMTHTGQWLKAGFWNGQAQTKDRGKIYLSTVSGELYALDVESERFTDLGLFIDPYDYRGYRHYRVHYLYGISLTAAEDRILGVPIITSNYGEGSDRTRLVVYTIASKTFAKKGSDMTRSVFTGSNHRDKAGRIYMSAFDWDTNCYLAAITP
jgi:hypothetical protein